jgi:hypothetical protein
MELPYQTFERVTRLSWRGGVKPEVVVLLNLFRITDTPGTAAANLKLQKALVVFDSIVNFIEVI